MDKKEDCEGCKWLDATRGRGAQGYCCKVVRSSQKNLKRETKFGEVSAKVRDETTERCELYEKGSFDKRYE